MAPPRADTSVPPKRREYEKSNGGLVVMKWTHVAFLAGVLASAGGVVAYAAGGWVNELITVHKGSEPVRSRLRKIETTVIVVHENKEKLEKLDDRQRKFEIQQRVGLTKLDALLARPSGNGR